MMTSFYPMHINIEGRKCLVVGGGNTAERKVATLVRYGGKVVVVSPEATPRLRSYAQKRKILWHKRRFKLTDLRGAFLVFSATDSKTLNRKIGQEAKKRTILVNVLDTPEDCDFISPSLVERGQLTISISTAGLAPLLSKHIRKDLEHYFGREYRRYTLLVAQVRSALVRDKTLTAQEKKKKLRQLLSLPIIDQLARGNRVYYRTILKKLGLSD
jgi:precorrin-2 dehydrogenase/sirohydrochlorin ferrochelatase